MFCRFLKFWKCDLNKYSKEPSVDKCDSVCGMTHNTEYSGSGTSVLENNYVWIFRMWMLVTTYQTTNAVVTQETFIEHFEHIHFTDTYVLRSFSPLICVDVYALPIHVYCWQSWSVVKDWSFEAWNSPKIIKNSISTSHKTLRLHYKDKPFTAVIGNNLCLFKVYMKQFVSRMLLVVHVAGNVL